MPKSIKMDKTSFSLDDLMNLLVASGIIAMEELVKHPLGTFMGVLGLIYMSFRILTQRVAYKIKVHELEDIEKDGKDIKSNKERKSESKD